MDEGLARKRYKMIRRELDRLTAKGQSDVELATQLEQLVVAFPQLREVTAPISASTAAMLNHGEAVSQEENSIGEISTSSKNSEEEDFVRDKSY